MFKVKRSTYNNTTTFAINEYTLKKKKFYLKVFLNLYFRNLKTKPIPMLSNFKDTQFVFIIIIYDR